MSACCVCLSHPTKKIPVVGLQAPLHDKIAQSGQFVDITWSAAQLYIVHCLSSNYKRTFHETLSTWPQTGD